MKRIASGQDFFGRKKDEQVTIGMRAAQPKDFHCARIAMKDKAAVNGHRWQSDLNILKFGKIGFGFGEFLLDGFLLFGA